MAQSVESNLLRIQAMITGTDFESWRQRFVKEHMDSFSYEEENKLIYTEIHSEYEAEIERRISVCLGEESSAFMQALPTYLEGPGRGNERAGKAITLLLEASDFIQFREMMLFTKRQKDERSESKITGVDDRDVVDQHKMGAELSAFDFHGMMDLCAQLSNASQDDGWVVCFENDWMKICKKPVEASNRRSSSEIYLKGVWTMNLSVVQACDMMFTMDHERRKNWDNNTSKFEFPLGGSTADDDVVIKAILDFGYLVNLVMFGGRPGELVSRNIRRWNVPSRGAVTYAMIPWLVSSNSMDRNHKLLSLKTGTIAPHPTSPDKCIMTSLEINSMGGMPTWALHWMMRATAPSMMKGLESRYTAYVKKTGDVRDLTPFGSLPPSVAEEKFSELSLRDSKKSEK